MPKFGDRPHLIAAGIYTAFKAAVARSPALYRRARVTLNLARYVAGRPHERDFEYLRSAPVYGLLLDVGANNGMSALSLRIVDRRSPILSIEASVLMEPALRLVKRVISDFDYRIVGAGAEHDRFTLYTPCYRGTPITGEASLRPPRPEDVTWLRVHAPDVRPDQYSVHKQLVDVMPLDELELEPAFVKIDVEGAELGVLIGLRRTLDRCRPTILLERGRDHAAVTDFLAGLNYRPHVYLPTRGTLVPDEEHSSLNVYFLPDDA